MNPRYRQLEHTSDIKVEIYGRDLPELFANAAFCLFDIMLDHSRVRPRRTETVSLESSDLSELFLDWLRELLFLFSTQSFAVARAEVRISSPQSKVQNPKSSPSPARLTARLWSEPYDLKRHGLKIEIKTPTYHEYKLEQVPEGYRATLVLDV